MQLQLDDDVIDFNTGDNFKTPKTELGKFATKSNFISSTSNNLSKHINPLQKFASNNNSNVNQSISTSNNQGSGVPTIKSSTTLFKAQTIKTSIRDSIKDGVKDSLKDSIKDIYKEQRTTQIGTKSDIQTNFALLNSNNIKSYIKPQNTLTKGISNNDLSKSNNNAYVFMAANSNASGINNTSKPDKTMSNFSNMGKNYPQTTKGTSTKIEFLTTQKKQNSIKKINK